MNCRITESTVVPASLWQLSHSSGLHLPAWCALLRASMQPQNSCSHSINPKHRPPTSTKTGSLQSANAPQAPDRGKRDTQDFLRAPYPIAIYFTTRALLPLYNANRKHFRLYPVR